MSISQDLLQSKFHVSALPNWYTDLIPRFSRDVIVYHASRLPALNILDKLIKVDTIGRCPIQRLNGTEVFFSVYSHYDSSSQQMSPRSKKISFWKYDLSGNPVSLLVPFSSFWNHLHRGCIVHDVTELFIYIYYIVHIYMAWNQFIHIYIYTYLYNSHVNVVATSLQLHLRWVLFDPKV